MDASELFPVITGNWKVSFKTLTPEQWHGVISFALPDLLRQKRYLPGFKSIQQRIEEAKLDIRPRRAAPYYKIGDALALTTRMIMVADLGMHPGSRSLMRHKLCISDRGLWVLCIEMGETPPPQLETCWLEFRTLSISDQLDLLGAHTKLGLTIIESICHNMLETLMDRDRVTASMTEAYNSLIGLCKKFEESVISTSGSYR
jgi:hypothetical protein